MLCVIALLCNQAKQPILYVCVSVCKIFLNVTYMINVLLWMNRHFDTIDTILAFSTTINLSVCMCVILKDF